MAAVKKSLSCFLEKSNKTDKLLVRLMKKKKKKQQAHKKSTRSKTQDTTQMLQTLKKFNNRIQ